DRFFELTVVHEVAHQWWYNVVGNDVIDEPWLDEALVQYSTLLYYEEVHGRARYDQVLRTWQQMVDQAVEEGRDDVVGSPMSHWAGRGDAYGLIVYIKGPLFFHALREEMGDEAFFEALRRYYQTYKYGIAEPEGLLSIAEEVSGQELDELYRHWILAAEGR
ncbi:MAG TPA: M1 family peptidase, partial [Anaerolineae bacterium]|nr:M1 family peptidase [Anaerolineae bacterium]